MMFWSKSPPVLPPQIFPDYLLQISFLAPHTLKKKWVQLVLLVCAWILGHQLEHGQLI